MTDTPHLALPLRIIGNDFVFNEQDSTDDIHDCVEAIIRTPVGSRIEAPTFGVQDQTFTVGALAAAALETAVQQQEPRAAAAAAEEDVSVGEFVAAIKVEIQEGS